MTSEKEKTNRKWTSTGNYRNNYDNVFGWSVINVPAMAGEAKALLGGSVEAPAAKPRMPPFAQNITDADWDRMSNSLLEIGLSEDEMNAKLHQPIDEDLRAENAEPITDADWISLSEQLLEQGLSEDGWYEVYQEWEKEIQEEARLERAEGSQVVTYYLLVCTASNTSCGIDYEPGSTNQVVYRSRAEPELVMTIIENPECWQIVEVSGVVRK